MIARAVYVTCDRCGAPGPVDCFDGARGARTLARSRGFILIRRRGEPTLDLCSRCARAQDPC